MRPPQQILWIVSEGELPKCVIERDFDGAPKAFFIVSFAFGVVLDRMAFNFLEADQRTR